MGIIHTGKATEGPRRLSVAVTESGLRDERPSASGSPTSNRLSDTEMVASRIRPRTGRGICAGCPLALLSEETNYLQTGRF